MEHRPGHELGLDSASPTRIPYLLPFFFYFTIIGGMRERADLGSVLVSAPRSAWFPSAASQCTTVTGVDFSVR